MEKTEWMRLMRSLRKKITEVSSLCAQDPMSGELPPLKPRLHWCLWMKYYIGGLFGYWDSEL